MSGLRPGEAEVVGISLNDLGVTSEEPFCRSEWDDWHCTRAPGHEGPHAASITHKPAQWVAVWFDIGVRPFDACAHPPIATLQALSCSSCHAFKISGEPTAIAESAVDAIRSYRDVHAVVSVTIEPIDSVRPSDTDEPRFGCPQCGKASCRCPSENETERHGWKIRRGAAVVECPGCGFAMGVEHESIADENAERPGESFYDCPNCGDARSVASGRAAGLRPSDPKLPQLLPVTAKADVVARVEALEGKAVRLRGVPFGGSIGLVKFAEADERIRFVRVLFANDVYADVSEDEIACVLVDPVGVSASDTRAVDPLAAVDPDVVEALRRICELAHEAAHLRPEPCRVDADGGLIAKALLAHCPTPRSRG